jgi:hypothetical protein
MGFYFAWVKAWLSRRMEMLSSGLIFHGKGENGIAIVDVANKNVAMPKA